MALTRTLRPANSVLGLIRYLDWSTDNRENELLDAYSEIGINKNLCTIHEYNRFDPDTFGNAFQKWLAKVQLPRVLIDISTMSRLAIMIVLDACRRAQKLVTVFYTEAETYGPSFDEYECARRGIYPRPSVQVYSGVGGIVRSWRLSSVALQGEPASLIAFMSMNEVLTQALINVLSPSKLLLINGRPPVHSWREAATAWIHDDLRKEWPESDNPCHVSKGGECLPDRATSTLKYTETVSTLLDLYWKNAADFRIVLAPTGSKMQTVACSVVKGIHRDIHIEYPTPESFLRAYSTGIGSKWLIEFGDLSARLQEWRSAIMSSKLNVLHGTRAHEALGAGQPTTSV